MKDLFRSVLPTGVAAMTAVAITFAPPAPERTAEPSRVVSQPVRLTASVEPLAVSALPSLLTDFLIPPSAGQPFPEPEFPPVVVGNSLGTGIKNIYNAVEPWVRWGFEVATYAVGWVPYVGWLSGQIMIFYNLGERIARSITFNFADWIDGTISFGQGLQNVTRDTINSFIFFANDELAFWLPPLPPIPPLPPLGPLAATDAEPEVLVTASTTDQAAAPATVVAAAPAEEAEQPEALTAAKDEAEAVVDDQPSTTSLGSVQAQGEVRDSMTGNIGGKGAEAKPTTARVTPKADARNATADQSNALKANDANEGSQASAGASGSKAGDDSDAG